MTARPSTPSLSRLLELLELEQPRVVSRQRLEEWAQEAGISWPTNVVLQRLRQRGWLLDLKTRGVWEFAPAARAGAFGADDPLIDEKILAKLFLGLMHDAFVLLAPSRLATSGRQA